jgi:hypothetical protein
MLNYKCIHCDERTKDPEARSARETCFVSPNGRHKWGEAVETQGQFDMPYMPNAEEVYGE